MAQVNPIMIGADLCEGLDLSNAEDAFIRESRTATTSDMNQSQAVAAVYVVKNLDRMVKTLVDSNERLSTSNERYARGLNWLTSALVFVGLVQVALQLFGQG